MQYSWDFKNDTPGELPSDWEVVDRAQDAIVECVISENQTLKLTATPNGPSPRIQVDFSSLLPDLQSVIDVDAVLRFKLSGSENIGTGIGLLSEYYAVSQVGLSQNSPIVALNTPNVQDYVIGSIPIQPDTWYFARIKFNGPSLSIKYWTSGEPEPDWMLGIEDPERSSNPGIVAFFGGGQLGTSAATIEWDYVGIGINGAEAPMPSEETPEPEPEPGLIATLVLETTQNQVLNEGFEYEISGGVMGYQSDVSIDVKYQINDGEAQKIISTTTDVVDPIYFSKVLTYKNKRLWDGTKAVTETELGESVDHMLTVWLEDTDGNKIDEAVRVFRVVWLTRFEYKLSGRVIGFKDGSVITVKYKVNNGNEYTLLTHTVNANVPVSFEKILEYYNKRLWDGSTDVVGYDLDGNTYHMITIWAEDDQGLRSEDIYRTFTIVEPDPPDEDPLVDLPPIISVGTSDNWTLG